MGCCSCNDEERPVLNVLLQDEFRRGRKAEDFQNHKLLRQILKHICATLCLFKPSGWRLSLGIFVAIICIFPVVFTLSVICDCPNFHCNSDSGYPERKRLESDKYVNRSAPNLKALPAGNVLLSISGLFSYNFLLISLSNMYRRRRQGKGQAISPSDALFNDLSNTQVKYLFFSQITITAFFIPAGVLYFQMILSEPTKQWNYYLVIIGFGSGFVAIWAATVGCYAFAISCLALGTFANDTVRRIKEIRKESKNGREGNRTTGEKPSTSQAEKIDKDGNPESALSAENVVRCTNDFDLAFEYHEELCVIVSDTVSAYCSWFVMHWLCYGATCLILVIFMSELGFTSRSGLSVAYIGVIFVVILHLFLLPCICAAYITDTCGGISARVNATTPKDWHEDHPFRDRAKLMMFTAYAKDRQCMFKIGRLTFTPTLAWISLLLGSTGLLYHFFEQ